MCSETRGVHSTPTLYAAVHPATQGLRQKMPERPSHACICYTRHTHTHTHTHTRRCTAFVCPLRCPADERLRRRQRIKPNNGVTLWQSTSQCPGRRHGTDSRWNCGPRRFPLTHLQKSSKLISLAASTSEDFCLLGAIQMNILIDID